MDNQIANRLQAHVERAAMRDRGKEFLREKYPLLNKKFSVLARDACCTTALLSLRAQVENPTHVLCPEVHEG